MNKPSQQEFTTLCELGSYVEEQPFQSVFLVLDRAACEATGVLSNLSEVFKDRRVVEFDQFVENPRLEHILLGLDAFLGADPDLVITIGGGTAIDVGKLICCFASQNASPESIISDSNLISLNPVVPLAAVPTTAGSGSEATHFAVVYVDDVKYSVAHESILPDVSVVDPTLTYSMPPRLTAASGLDVICQGIEAMWSVNSTSESYQYGAEALELAFDSLRTAVHEPMPTVRAAMSRAAHLAGKAINISKTTAPHAVSYAITTGFGVPHGHAVALTLAPFLKFNRDVTQSDVTDSRGVQHVNKVLDQILEKLKCTTVADAHAAIQSLMESIGCASRLRDLGVTSSAQRLRIAQSVNAARLSNNPRAITEHDICEILESIR
jgi:alcohol dehydrogenase class IV